MAAMHGALHALKKRNEQRARAAQDPNYSPTVTPPIVLRTLTNEPIIVESQETSIRNLFKAMMADDDAHDYVLVSGGIRWKVSEFVFEHNAENFCADDPPTRYDAISGFPAYDLNYIRPILVDIFVHFAYLQELEIGNPLTIRHGEGDSEAKAVAGVHTRVEKIQLLGEIMVVARYLGSDRLFRLADLEANNEMKTAADELEASKEPELSAGVDPCA